MKKSPLLQIGLLLFTLSLSLIADEYTGRWTDERKAELAWEMVEHFREEQVARADEFARFDNELAVNLEDSFYEKVINGEHQKLLKESLNGSLDGKGKTVLYHGLFEELGENHQRLSKAERKASELWKEPSPNPLDTVDVNTVEIFGHPITAGRIGVILDSSPSMKKEIERLRAEIEASFSNHYFVEAATCELTGDGSGGMIGHRSMLGDESISTSAWFFADPPAGMNPFEEKWHSPRHFVRLNTERSLHREWVFTTRSPLSAIVAMSDLLKVDTLVWYSDFQDPDHTGFCKNLAKMFEKNGTRLYLVSHDERPNKALRDYADDSGGAYFDKRDIEQ